MQLVEIGAVVKTVQSTILLFIGVNRRQESRRSFLKTLWVSVVKNLLPHRIILSKPAVAPIEIRGLNIQYWQRCVVFIDCLHDETDTSWCCRWRNAAVNAMDKRFEKRFETACQTGKWIVEIERILNIETWPSNLSNLTSKSLPNAQTHE
jgi:hypothetical protein